jgi:hypothetical protein
MPSSSDWLKGLPFLAGEKYEDPTRHSRPRQLTKYRLWIRGTASRTDQGLHHWSRDVSRGSCGDKSEAWDLHDHLSERLCLLWDRSVSGVQIVMPKPVIQEMGFELFQRRVWPNIIVTNNLCWEWQAGTDRHGYGVTWIAKKHKSVHRVTYEILKSSIPEGLELDHLCRNPACCNPTHLEPVTHRENCLRGTSPAAIHARKTHCNSGHALSGDNLSIHKDGARICRACCRIQDKLQRIKGRKGRKPQSTNPGTYK